MKRLRSIFLNGGQGDALMVANGLHALMTLQAPVLAEGAVYYTRTNAVPVVQSLLPEILCRPLSEGRHAARPRYHCNAVSSWSSMLRNWFGPDYYVNYAYPRNRASRGYPHPPAGLRFAQWLSDAKLYRTFGWRSASPAYYGLRIWTPMAYRLGIDQVSLLRGLHQSHAILAERLRRRAEERSDLPPVAIFPAGKSFQTMPPRFARELVADIADSVSTFYFAPGDESIRGYQSAGVRCEVTQTMEDVIAVVAGSRVVVTVDSFVSHVAQLVARRHIALMSHDLPQHTVHPAAASRIVFVAMPCVPCHYSPRAESGRCIAGFPHCGVFSDANYAGRARDVLRESLDAA